MSDKYWSRTQNMVLLQQGRPSPPGGKNVVLYDTGAKGPNDTVLRVLCDIQIVTQTITGQISGWGDSWWLGQQYVALISVNSGTTDSIVFATGTPDPRVVATEVLRPIDHHDELSPPGVTACWQNETTIQSQGQRRAINVGQNPTPTVTLWQYQCIPQGEANPGWTTFILTYLRVLYERH